MLPPHAMVVESAQMMEIANVAMVFMQLIAQVTLQAGIDFKKNLRVRFGKYGVLKLEYFCIVKSKKAKSFILG